MNKSIERPAMGGSYIRKKDGSLERVESKASQDVPSKAASTDKRIAKESHVAPKSKTGR